MTSRLPSSSDESRSKSSASSAALTRRKVDPKAETEDAIYNPAFLRPRSSTISHRQVHRPPVAQVASAERVAMRQSTPSPDVRDLRAEVSGQTSRVMNAPTEPVRRIPTEVPGETSGALKSTPPFYFDMGDVWTPEHLEDWAVHIGKSADWANQIFQRANGYTRLTSGVEVLDLSEVDFTQFRRETELQCLPGGLVCGKRPEGSNKLIAVPLCLRKSNVGPLSHVYFFGPVDLSYCRDLKLEVGKDDFQCLVGKGFQSSPHASFDLTGSNVVLDDLLSTLEADKTLVNVQGKFSGLIVRTPLSQLSVKFTQVFQRYEVAVAPLEDAPLDQARFAKLRLRRRT